MKLCKYCKKYYPESNFGVALTTPKKVYRRHKCKYCYSATKKLLHAQYQKWLNEYKKQHGCSKCGNKNYKVLEFHHLRDKNFEMALYICKHHSFKKITNEAKKCTIMCANCHRILHNQKRMRELKTKANYCNTGSKMLSYNKKSDTKVCKYCKKSYPESDFYIANIIKGKIYRRHKCKYCYYLTKQKLREKRQQWLDDFRKRLKCVKCGFKDYRALEFHHLHDKRFNISAGLSKDHLSLKCIEKELSKCVVICANCHKLLHNSKPALK